MKLSNLDLRSLIPLDFIFHYQTLYWGEEIILMKNDGRAICRAYVFSERENELFIEGLSVDRFIRKCGWGTKLIHICHLIAKCSNRESVYLFALRGSWMYMWYVRMGYTFHSANNDMSGYDWLKIELT